MCSDPIMSFSIVEFLASKSVAIISSKWFASEEEDECRWPPVSSTKAVRLAREHTTPNDSWDLYEIRTLGKASTAPSFLILLFL